MDQVVVTGEKEIAQNQYRGTGYPTNEHGADQKDPCLYGRARCSESHADPAGYHLL